MCDPKPTLNPKPLTLTRPYFERFGGLWCRGPRPKSNSCRGFLKTRGCILGVPKIKIGTIVFWGLHWDPAYEGKRPCVRTIGFWGLNWDPHMKGNFHVGSSTNPSFV